MSAALYFVEAARPASSAAGARVRVEGCEAKRTVHANEATARHVAVTSVTPKWESRTCRKAAARKAAAVRDSSRGNQRRAVRYRSQTESTPAAALSSRAER